MHLPTTGHLQAVKRVLRYLAGTMTHGIFLSRNNTWSLHGFSDADWGGNTEDYVSTNAFIVYLGNQPVSWSSRKQNTVARSSIEAEYRSVANTSSEICWIHSLLDELGVPINSGPVIYCDNVGATYLCANLVFHSRMKHVALDYHFIRQ
ncbi:Retrovirus-related Pol polyprotein from transposon RE1 [Cardamine amara subsp. amara]|uniref:Retrovirus-related Pol polyprotein from transposon RE1 n=1 Tax=Cardamine amara subsp. amara TaxID=228776 RepID=A0ABD1B193_CARAN